MGVWVNFGQSKFARKGHKQTILYFYLVRVHDFMRALEINFGETFEYSHSVDISI